MGILETVSRYINNKEIVRSSQRGFTNGKACMTNVMSFYHEMTSLVDDKKAVGFVCTDFGKVLESVSHNILIDKPLMNGLNKQTVRRIENWFNGWAQRVVISGTKSC